MKRFFAYKRYLFVACLLLAGEIGSRIFVLYHTPSYLLPLPEIGFSYQTGSVVAGLTLNDIGCIGDDVRLGKQESERRVFILGDEATFSRAMVDSLRDLLRPLKPDERIKVVSCGKPGYTSFSNVQNYQRILSNYSPDLLIVYHATGDNLYNTSPWVTDLPELEYFDWRATDHSILLSLTRFHLIDRGLRARKNYTEDEVVSGTKLGENLKGLIKSAYAFRANLLFVTQSLAYPSDDPALAKILDFEQEQFAAVRGRLASAAIGVFENNKALREVAEFNQVPLVETVGQIPSTSDNFEGLVKLSDAGAARWSLLVATQIARLNLLEPPTPALSGLVEE